MGRKKGASFGALGGSTGLFLCLTTSRFSRFDHRDFGRDDRVTKSLASGVHFSEISSMDVLGSTRLLVLLFASSVMSFLTSSSCVILVVGS